MFTCVFTKGTKRYCCAMAVVMTRDVNQEKADTHNLWEEERRQCPPTGRTDGTEAVNKKKESKAKAV